MDCPHPQNKRFTYRDAAAPLGREGQERCDACDQPVPPDHDDRMEQLASGDVIDLTAMREQRQRDRLLDALIAIVERWS